MRKSSTSRTVLGESCVKKVVLVVTRKPAALAALIAATALSKTPSRSTDASWRSRSPSMWIAQEKYGLGLKLLELLLQQQRVRAQVDELLALDQLGRDHVDLGVDQRLAAGDRDHRRAALLDRADRLLDGHPPAQLVLGVLDLAAARAGEVALEQRLELDDQRELARVWPAAGASGTSPCACSA